MKLSEKSGNLKIQYLIFSKICAAGENFKNLRLDIPEIPGN